MRFEFVTVGIGDEAVARARAAATGNDVTIIIGGAATVRQCPAAGLVDELLIDLRPVSPGDGLRLFERLDGAALRHASRLQCAR